MTSYGNSSKQELQSGQENPDGRTDRHRAVIVVTNIIWKKNDHWRIKGNFIDEAK